MILRGDAGKHKTAEYQGIENFWSNHKVLIGCELYKELTQAIACKVQIPERILYGEEVLCSPKDNSNQVQSNLE